MWIRAMGNAMRWVTKERIERVLDLALTPLDVLADVSRRATCLVRGHVPPPSPHPRYVDKCERCEQSVPKPHDFMHASGAKRAEQDGDWKDAWNTYPPSTRDDER